MPRLPVSLALLSLLAAVAPASAQDRSDVTGARGSEACAGLDAAEQSGRTQVNRRLGDIDAAADAGDTSAFCAATADLLFVYRSMRQAAASCAAGRERAAGWERAERQTTAALAQTCP